MEGKRKWTELSGRNKFCCDGRVMMARHTGVFYFTLGLIVGSMLIFFFFDGQFLWLEISPAIPIIAGVLELMVVSSLLKASFSDPGVLPRAGPHEAAQIEHQINAENNYVATEVQYQSPPRTKEVTINGQQIKLKYCFTCKVFRPPRSSHCSICDNCILNFDHHCPWVGNCVGQRNYRHFYFFIVTLSLLVVYVFGCASLHLGLMSKEEKSFLDAIHRSPATLVVALICFFSIWSILGLAGFHTYLLTSSQTTNEDIKGTFNSKRRPNARNPYSVGSIFANCLRSVCGPQQPSLLDRRGLIKPENVVVIPIQLWMSLSNPTDLDTQPSSSHK